MAKLIDIEAFLAPGKIAIAGVSRNPKKFSRVVYKNLKNKNFDIVPVNPNTEEIDGDKCFKDIACLPGDIKKLLILTPKKETENVINDAIVKGVEIVWVQPGAESASAIEIAQQSDLKLINKECILMHLKPAKGIHGFHAFLAKLFGSFPK